MRLIDADALKEKSIIISDGPIYKEVIPISDIDNAPTVEYPEQITINCDTEEDKQKLLSVLRNAKLFAIDWGDEGGKK